MNHFEYGFFDELEKIATVEDGTLSLPEKVRFSTSIPDGAYRKLDRDYEDAKRAYQDKAEKSLPVHAGILGSLIAGGLPVASSGLDATLAGILFHQTVGDSAARALGRLAGRASHAINRFGRINRANKYLEGRRAAAELK